MDAFVLCVLVVLLMSLPALSWWGRLAQRKHRLDTMADQRLLNFVTRNANATANHAPSPNQHARANLLAERYFDDITTLGMHRRGHAHAHPSEHPGFHEPECHPDINPASGLPMLDSAIDVAGNPFGFNWNNDLHHGMSVHHASDSFSGHDLSGHSIGHDLHSGHDAFGHGSSWLD